MVVGLLLGSLAGYYGGLIDNLLSKLFELFMMLPPLFLLIVTVSIFGNNIILMIIILGITTWPSNARIARTQVLSLKQRGFVRAARGLGANSFRILFRHIIPNGIYPIIANATLQVGNAILMEAGLSFLGLGDPNQISWGQILYRGQFVYRLGWWMAFFPGIAIFLAAFAFNVVGDGINSILSPGDER
jgi:peptide/nickel transport system permease protein